MVRVKIRPFCLIRAHCTELQDIVPLNRILTAPVIFIHKLDQTIQSQVRDIIQFLNTIISIQSQEKQREQEHGRFVITSFHDTIIFLNAPTDGNRVGNRDGNHDGNRGHFDLYSIIVVASSSNGFFDIPPRCVSTFHVPAPMVVVVVVVVVVYQNTSNQHETNT